MIGRLHSPLRCAILPVVGLVATAPAAGQLVPNRLYYGVNRSIPMTIAQPANGQGEMSIQLLEPGTAKVVESAKVNQPGEIDLAGVFPTIWTKQTPALVYAQLVIGEKKIGPAVVLQPMITPAYPVVMDQTTLTPRFPSEARRKAFTGYRAYIDKHVVLETSKGTITFALRPDAAPNTAWNFRELVDGGFYTDVKVHRIVALNQAGQPFVIQTGDPSGKGDGGPGYNIDMEPSALAHDFGVISMARNDDPNTAGSQFFICLSREGCSFLDGKYTSFGQCVDGAQAIQAIAAVPISPVTSAGRDRPIDPPTIISARLVDAPPYGEGPAPVVSPASGPVRK